MRPVLALALLLLATPAWAQTRLKLSEYATVMVAPDELSGSFTATAEGPSAADIQRRVNETVKAALAAAKSATHTSAATGPYFVWQVWNKNTFQARQSVELKGNDGPELLALAANLQKLGLETNGLTWRLSRDKQRDAQKQATTEALSKLRGRAEEAAEVLGLRFDRFAEVRMGSERGGPVPMLAAAAPMVRGVSSAAPTPPEAVPQDIAVSASVDADANLIPK